jgi:hypothetical protein
VRFAGVPKSSTELSRCGTDIGGDADAGDGGQRSVNSGREPVLWRSHRLSHKTLPPFASNTLVSDGSCEPFKFKLLLSKANGTCGNELMKTGGLGEVEGRRPGDLIDLDTDASEKLV